MGIILEVFKSLINMVWLICKWPIIIGLGMVLAFMIISCGYLMYYRFVKGMKPPQGIHYKPKKPNLLKTLFYLAPKQFAIDKLTRNPEFFRHQGLIIYTGNQGSGKTSTCVRDMMLMQEEYPKCKAITNFGYTKQDKELKHWKQLVQYKNGIQGVVVGIDEIQNWFNSKQSKNFPPEMLQIVTTNRKNRRCIMGTAQRFYMVSKDIRTQCSEVRHCMTLCGVLTIVIRKVPIVNSEGEVEKERFKGIYCWAHTKETREAYDTYKMIDVLAQDGFKEESEQYRLQNNKKEETTVNVTMKK